MKSILISAPTPTVYQRSGGSWGMDDHSRGQPTFNALQSALNSKRMRVTQPQSFAAQSWADPRALSAEVPSPNLVPPHLHRQHRVVVHDFLLAILPFTRA